MQYNLVKYAYAKINLLLKVIGKRADGYHELQTVFQTVNLFDKLYFRITQDTEIKLVCNNIKVPADRKNLIIRAALALQRAANIQLGAEIYLEKHIPIGAGLGGGSSNAAVALLALKKLWSVGLPDSRIEEIARRLGSDIPFFLTGGTAFGTGRGDIITPLPDLDFPYILLVNPKIHIHTAKVFSLLRTRLTSKNVERILPAHFLFQAADYHKYSCNDLEPVVFAHYPEVQRLFKELKDYGARVVQMSGSGSTIFGIFDSREALDKACKRFVNDNFYVWTCRSVSQVEYARYLNPIGSGPLEDFNL